MTIIVQESERLSRLINDILDLAKMQAGTTEWQISEHRLGPIIEQAVAATSGLLTHRPDVVMSVDIPATLPPAMVDPDRLIQVVVNLVSNAVKFCDKADGRIAIVARARDGWLEVDVADNGVGIGPEDIDKIFERFQQAGNTLTDKPQGTGLGLPISRQILQRFGGDISVVSEIGRGSTFTFRIPALDKSAAALADENVAAA